MQNAAKSASTQREMVHNDSPNMSIIENDHNPFCDCFGPRILSHIHVRIVAGAT